MVSPRILPLENKDFPHNAKQRQQISRYRRFDNLPIGDKDNGVLDIAGLITRSSGETSPESGSVDVGNSLLMLEPLILKMEWMTS